MGVLQGGAALGPRPKRLLVQLLCQLELVAFLLLALGLAFSLLEVF